MVDMDSPSIRRGSERRGAAVRDAYGKEREDQRQNGEERQERGRAAAVRWIGLFFQEAGPTLMLPFYCYHCGQSSNKVHLFVGLHLNATSNISIGLALNMLLAAAFFGLQVPGLVNVDFADVRSIMSDAGSSLMGIGTATGKTRARDAALNAIQSPLLDIGIERATGIVWNITGGNDLTLTEVNAAAEVIYDLVDPGANLIFGSVIDPSYTGQVSITLIATGFKRQEESENRSSQAGGDSSRGRSGWFSPTSQEEGPALQIPEFLQRKGRSGFPRV